MTTIRGRGSVLTMRHRNLAADERRLRRSTARGEFVRLPIGAYVPTAVWRSLSPEERHRLAVAAAADMRASLAISHRSAGAIWGVPSVARPDGLVHARSTTAAGTRTEHGFRKHAVHGLEQHLTTIDGITVTTLARTVLDLAATEDFAEGVVAADWALAHGVSEEALRVALDEWSPARGRPRIEAVLDFADAASGSAGESLSRVLVAESGLPAPVLQQAFFDDAGLIGFVDFWWPDFGLVGEFDGYVKYSDPAMLQGRTPAEAVMAEKVREDRLRASAPGPAVTRWIWPTLREDGGLALQLLRAGLRRTSGPGRTIRA